MVGDADGATVGTSVGVDEGWVVSVGLSEGTSVGQLIWFAVGIGEGSSVGWFDGSSVGYLLGELLGCWLGHLLGGRVGRDDGAWVGDRVVGFKVGFVGKRVGLYVEGCLEGRDGWRVGELNVGHSVGYCVDGVKLGIWVGNSVGKYVGISDGRLEGISVGKMDVDRRVGNADGNWEGEWVRATVEAELGFNDGTVGSNVGWWNGETLGNREEIELERKVGDSESTGNPDEGSDWKFDTKGAFVGAGQRSLLGE